MISPTKHNIYFLLQLLIIHSSRAGLFYISASGAPVHCCSSICGQEMTQLCWSCSNKNLQWTCITICVWPFILKGAHLNSYCFYQNTNGAEQTPRKGIHTDVKDLWLKKQRKKKVGVFNHLDQCQCKDFIWGIFNLWNIFKVVRALVCEWSVNCWAPQGFLR